MNKAFTLLEVMMAMAVLGIASAGLVSAFATVSRLGETMECEVLAQDLIRDRLAEIRADALENLSTTIETRVDNSGVPEGITISGRRLDVTVELFLREAFLQEGFLPQAKTRILESYFGLSQPGLDLDGDGNLNGDYSSSSDFSALKMVPVMVTVEWPITRNVNASATGLTLLARRN